MASVSRRKFIVGGSAGAIGVTAAAGLVRSGSGVDSEPELSEAELEATGAPVLLQVRDAASGEVELLVDEQEIVFTDKKLVARVLRVKR